nr:hypothetical protein [Lysinibacillus timonensis]
MEKRILSFLLALTFLVAGCARENFTPINQQQSFIATVNILEPSLSFYDDTGHLMANWDFEKSYTGAILIQQDRVLLYGHQLTEADIYELSSGKLVTTIQTGVGTTNAYYSIEDSKIFLTNSVTNKVTSYDLLGNKLIECQLGNYPMSMASYNGKLYVINYKDTKLSILDIESMKLIDEWQIEKSSNGLMILPEKNTIWLGGHGEGSKANQKVKVLDLEDGKFLKEIKVSMMPVNFARSDNEVYAINHGSNELYVMNLDGELLWDIEVGANPFAVESFSNSILVAGFDDHKFYIINNRSITKTIETGNGPFQLIVREVK